MITYIREIFDISSRQMCRSVELSNEYYLQQLLGTIGMYGAPAHFVHAIKIWANDRVSPVYKYYDTSLRSKCKKEEERGEEWVVDERNTEEEEWGGGKRKEGSACNQSPLYALPLTFQNCVILSFRNI